MLCQKVHLKQVRETKFEILISFLVLEICNAKTNINHIAIGNEFHSGMLQFRVL